MNLLTKMLDLQEEHGALPDDLLRKLAREEHVPLQLLEGLRGYYPAFRAFPGPKMRVKVCRDISCRMKGGANFVQSVRSALRSFSQVDMQESSCLGRCDSAPVTTVKGISVGGPMGEISAFAAGEQPLPRDKGSAAGRGRSWPTDPYSRQDEHYGTLRSWIEGGGDEKKKEAAATLKASGLQGMGGAGFPTGAKWELAAAAEGDEKYVICNADESEPGTFKDRVILAELSHLVIEAMVLAGWSIGARSGIIFLRNEYRRERRILEEALGRAREAGALGDSVFGSGFGFDIRIFISPGGYILGEETALLEVLEGRRGEPRCKPPFPTQQGLHGRPTLINNVETLAAVPVILARGAQWWRDQGVGDSTGLKFFSVSGDVAHSGVHCVAMGTTAAELLEMCGGMAKEAPLQAFAPGGASSGILPAAKSDVPLDFNTLKEEGSMLGSGGVIFFAGGRDLAALSLNLVQFFRNESCGKCVPCRVGCEKAVLLVEAALEGNPRAGLIPLLRELGETLAQTSLCGLGQVALTPILSVIDNFPAAALRLSEGGEKGGEE